MHGRGIGDSKEAQDAAQQPSKSGWGLPRSFVWFLGLSAAIAALVFSLLVWQSDWDKPERMPTKIVEGTFTYKGNPIQVSVTCDDCPVHLIQSHRQDLHLTFNLKRIATGSVVSSAPPRPGSDSAPQHSAQTKAETPMDLDASPAETMVAVWSDLPTGCVRNGGRLWLCSFGRISGVEEL